MTTKQLIARIGFTSMVFVILGTLVFGMISSIGWFGALVVFSMIFCILLVVAAFMWCANNM
jgi:hypothetical protein